MTFLPLAPLLVALSVGVQVPAPDREVELGSELREARRAILAEEAQAIRAWAKSAGKTEANAEVSRWLPAEEPPDGPTRFRPLPEIVPAAPAKTDVPEGVRRARVKSVDALMALARRASTKARYGTADDCLRDVIARQSDHAETRRLLGFVPHAGGWATPYAVQSLKAGKVPHPVFGWVDADWIEHLIRGELPAPKPPGSRAPTTWLPTAEADRLRQNWNQAWEIRTEHFQVRTNATLAEGVAFGRRLEAFHQLFLAHMADVIGDALPLAVRFRDPKAVPTPRAPHRIFFFASKADYVEYLKPAQGPDIANSLGVYLPRKDSARLGLPTGTSFFFKEAGLEIDVESTLYHEVSHQLLFELAGKARDEENVGNFWVFEGLGTYFETVRAADDGVLEVGGRVGPRLEAARQRLVEREELVPVSSFVAMGRTAFNQDRVIYLHYQEAIALTTYLMQAERGRFRDAFFDYVQDAYRGRLKRGNGRGLLDRVGLNPRDLESRLRAFLKEVPRTPAVTRVP